MQMLMLLVILLVNNVGGIFQRGRGTGLLILREQVIDSRRTFCRGTPPKLLLLLLLSLIDCYWHSCSCCCFFFALFFFFLVMYYLYLLLLLFLFRTPSRTGCGFLPQIPRRSSSRHCSRRTKGIINRFYSRSICCSSRP